MELSEYTGMLRGELAAITRFASEDVARAGQMLAEGLDSSVRLTLLDVLSVAAAEITAHLTTRWSRSALWRASLRIVDAGAAQFRACRAGRHGTPGRERR
jgi:hypothetical protein